MASRLYGEGVRPVAPSPAIAISEHPERRLRFGVRRCCVAFGAGRAVYFGSRWFLRTACHPKRRSSLSITHIFWLQFAGSVGAGSLWPWPARE